MTTTEAQKAWCKSSYSSSETACVEVGAGFERTGVRDTKAREQGNLDVAPEAWRWLVNQL